MASSELPPPERLQIPVPCDACDTGAAGKHYCTVCRKTLCNNCEAIHAKLLQEHKVVPRAEMPTYRDLACSHHASQNVTLYCEKCQCPVCVDCVTDEHKGHLITKLSAVVEKEKLKLQKDLSDTEEKELSSISKALVDLQAEEDSYKRDMKDVKKDMQDELENMKVELDKIKAEIDKAKDDLEKDLGERVQNLTETELQDLTKFNELRQQLKNREDKVKQKIEERKTQIERSNDNPVTFLHFMKSENTKPDIPIITKESSPVLQRPSTKRLTTSDMLRKINLQFISPSVSQSLKLIVPQIISSFKAKVQGYPCICTTKDGDAWIGGSKSKELILVNKNGDILNKRKIQHQTYDLAMMASGDIIMSTSGSSSVLRLGTDGTETVLYDAAPLTTLGLSVSSDQQILICVSRGKLVKCNNDGTNVHEIYNKGRSCSALFSIELPDKTICISDCSIRGLVIIDKHGQRITTITKPLGNKEYDPRALTCDRMGNILSSDWENDCVYIINQNRQVKEMMGAYHGLKRPIRVAIDPDNNLWVAQNDGTIDVVKYLA